MRCRTPITREPGTRRALASLRGARSRDAAMAGARTHSGTSTARDRLVLQEDDEAFEVTVGATRSGEWIVIESRSRDTSECWLLPSGGHHR